MNDLDALLREARRRLMRVRIEEHRLKAIMARLQAYQEDEAAHRLGQLLTEHAADDFALAAVLAAQVEDSPADSGSAERVGRVLQGPNPPQVTIRTDEHQGIIVPRDRAERRAQPLSRRRAAARKRPAAPPRRRRQLWPRRRPWVTSTVVHAVVLLVLAVLTMAALHEPEPMLLATIGQPSETEIAEFAEIEIVPAELELEPSDAPPLESPLPELGDAATIELAAHAEPVPTRDVGERVSAELPLGRAALMEASGTDAGEVRGGNSGAAVITSLPAVSFFGAEARADRIAFVVDNSNSMDDGRLETALLELTRCVDALTPTQSFYVVFYSDTAYGLFHPHTAETLVPATRENKLRLREWLGTVEMCLGGRVVDAFRTVEDLEPQVVYLLSDGVINSEAAMSYLTERRDWGFTVHTIGMTVPDRGAAQNLLAIAQANGGVFRAVDVSPLARVMDRRRPIKKNSSRGGVWGLKLRP